MTTDPTPAAEPAWVYMTHPAAGSSRLPNTPSVIADFESRGWVLGDLPAELDPDAPNHDLPNRPEQTTNQRPKQATKGSDN